LAASRALIARAREAGVTIACGSDAGVFSHGDNARELELLVEYGVTPREAFAAATSVAAKVLGRERELGAIDAGFAADLIALREDPLASVAALRSVAIVIARGQIAADRRSAK
jgi:imidazolonepropionase-like amidohydrolase